MTNYNSDPSNLLPKETLGFFESGAGEYSHIPEINGKIILEELPFSKDPWSPTPLDPLDLTTTEKVDYYPAALELMLDRFERRMAETDLDEASKALIRKEIETFHQKRCLKNTEAMDRLRGATRRNPELLTPEILASIYRARSAQASLMDKLDVLSTFPDTGSIGDIQATIPFNIPAMNAIASQHKKNVIEELWLRNIDFTILNKDTRYKTPNPHPLSPVAIAMGRDIISLNEAIEVYARMKAEAEQQPFVIAEKPILEIYYGGKTIEMVEGMNPFVAPAKRQLNNIPGNTVVIPGKGPVNLQNISYMTFLRIVPDEKTDMLYVESSESEDETSLISERS